MATTTTLPDPVAELEAAESALSAVRLRIGSGDPTVTVNDLLHAEVMVAHQLAGQTVVLDNLAVHKSAAARAVIEAAGCQLVFLPTCFPDFNPIEQAFAKLKHLLRQAEARTVDAIFATTQTAYPLLLVYDEIMELQPLRDEFATVYLPSRNLAANTRATYLRVVDTCLAYLAEHGITKVEAVGLRELNGYFAQLDRLGRSGTTRRLHTHALKAFFRFGDRRPSLEKHQHVTRSAAVRLIPPKSEDRTPRVLTETEYRRLREAVGNRPRMAAIVECRQPFQERAVSSSMTHALGALVNIKCPWIRSVLRLNVTDGSSHARPSSGG